MRLAVGAAAATAGAVVGAAYAGIVEPRRLRIRRLTLRLPRWPQRLDGLRVAVIADLHAGGPHVDEDRIEQIVGRVNGERPDLVEPILPPAEEVPFIIKARHTIFYGTPLEYFLGQNGIRHLVLAGQVTEQCILYSALDAYVRHLEITIPADAVAGIDRKLHEAALEMMAANMDAETPPAAEVSFTD